ncbi:MAG: NUDIX hydrolase [Clostridia bacterium]|nr:NUDIX hydrolase [Clostridia bacterium]
MRKEKLDELNNLIENYKTVEVFNKHKVDSGFLSIEQADYKLNNGKIINRDSLLKNNRDGSSCNVLAITKDKEVIFTVQPRVQLERTVGVEIPAGLIEDGESPVEAIKRELLEETGYTSNNFIKLVRCYQDEGCSKAIVNSFLALDCEKIQNQNLDDDEFISVFTCNYDEAFELIDMGYICGAFSIMALEMSKKYFK